MMNALTSVRNLGKVFSANSMFCKKSFMPNIQTNEGSLRFLGTSKQLLLKDAEQSSDSQTRTGHKVNNLEKKLLVYFKKYPTEAEVPSFVPQSTIEKVRNQARIRLNVFFMILTGFVSMILLVRSKRAAEEGDSLLKRSQDFHKKYNEQNPK